MQLPLILYNTLKNALVGYCKLVNMVHYNMYTWMLFGVRWPVKVEPELYITQVTTNVLVSLIFNKINFMFYLILQIV